MRRSNNIHKNIKNDFEIKKVSQEKTFGKDPEFGQGICAGLSVKNLFDELNSSRPTNPFEHPQDRTPFELQKCHENNQQKPAINCWKKLHPEQKYNLEDRENNFPLKKLAPELKTEVTKTMTDGRSRGDYIRFFFTFTNPDSSFTRDGHAVNFTVKKDNQIQCTALDSNQFYAQGKGQKGCNTVIDALSHKVGLYPSLEEIKLRKINKKPSF